MLDDVIQFQDVKKSKLSGVILAGGKNRRMNGFHKALLEFQSEKLIHRQIRMMSQICPEIILVTNEPKLFLPLVDIGVRIITDFYPDKGPLGGMHAAFSLANYSDIWLAGCDMPFISPLAAQMLLDMKREMGCDAVIPYIDNRLHPLHGIYDKTCVDAIPAMLNEGSYRVQSFLEHIRYERVGEPFFHNQGIPKRFVINMNTPEEYAKALSMELTIDV